MTPPPTVLLVDDDPAVGLVLSALLAQAGIQATTVVSGELALRALETEPFDLVVTDLRMPGMDGMELLRRAGERWPDVPVIVLTAHGTVALAVEAMRSGARDFLLKPFDADEVIYVVQKALAGRSDRDSVPPPPASSPSGIFGSTKAMRDVEATLLRAAPTTATVLVLGESGTGKEVVARAIHEGSRKTKPFIKVHCAALPEALLESELFGYEKGAFTGATARKPGRIELAHEGTLFLDEIGDVPLSMQVKLLRVLQEREFERLGGTQTVKVDVRFVAATHRDLGAMVEKGTFREDLFYRLSVVPIRLPPLRERPLDIERLARTFCASHRRHDGAAATLTQEATDLLGTQRWPGNVRQLQNFVERLVILSDGSLIDASDVKRELERETTWRATPAPTQAPAPRDNEREKEALLQALQRSGNNRTVAARLLGVSRRTFYNKLRDHGVS